MVSLELKGCGVLSEASINCPLLTSLDASFCRLRCNCYLLLWSFTLVNSWRFNFICSQLKDAFLSATTASFSLIESLILMSCPSIGSDGLYSLRWLPNLTTLDLSYTFLTNLQPVFESCLQLKVTLKSLIHKHEFLSHIHGILVLLHVQLVVLLYLMNAWILHWTVIFIDSAFYHKKGFCILI